MKYRVVLEVDVRENWCSVEDFTKYEIDAFNQANKPMLNVSVLDVHEIMGKVIKMTEIKTVDEAIRFLSEKVGISTEIVRYKYRVSDMDFDCPIRTDKDLIDYANEQKEAIEE